MGSQTWRCGPKKRVHNKHDTLHEFLLYNTPSFSEAVSSISEPGSDLCRRRAGKRKERRAA